MYDTSFAQGLELDLANSRVSIDGFASIAVAEPITKNLERSINDFRQLDNNTDWQSYNVLGLRLGYELGDRLNFTAQMVARGDENYQPDFDWMYLEYALTQHIFISAGRIRTPLFMYSEYLDVGYAYQWIQAPAEIYNTNDYPFQSIESVRLRYNRLFGDWENEFTFWYGSTEDQLTTNGIDTELKLNNAWGLSFSSIYNALTIRGVYFTANTSTDLRTVSYLNEPITADGLTYWQLIDQTNSAAQQNIDQNVDITEDIAWKRDRGEYISLGLAYTGRQYFFNTEVTHASIKHALVIPEVYSGYAMLGWQINSKLSISYTFGIDDNIIDDTAWASIEKLPTASDATTQQLINSSIAATKTIGETFQPSKIYSNKLNLRYDFQGNAALKFEYWWEKQRYPEVGTNYPKGARAGIDVVF
ncbi:MAG: hypothetical protein HRU21_02545 [Pseudomonadales bacterium]|nr:hypothetical protein [Pseudomonadales bacterium]